MLTQEQLKAELHYDPETGIFRRLVDRPKSKAGSIVGYPTDRGWLRVKIRGKHYKLHRLAFLYMTGTIPNEVDHANRIRDDNRWVNLREATRSQNTHNRNSGGNSQTGYRGVVKSGRYGYKALVSVNGERELSETFDSPEEAYLKYCEMATKAFGDYVNLS